MIDQKETYQQETKRPNVMRRAFARMEGRKFLETERTGPWVVAIIPAHNEADSISITVRSLLSQSRPPDLIVVAADNCSDGTVAQVEAFSELNVLVFETVDNKYRKVGALTQAWKGYCQDADYVLGVDADTRLETPCIEQLLAEMEDNPYLGGLMARYTFDNSHAHTIFARLLVRMQRMEFAGWTMDILRRDRRTYVLGGQATLFRRDALADVQAKAQRDSPWSTTAQVEDMELTWKLDEYGWETRCSAEARAYVGPMVTMKSFWAQRRKWDAGVVEILLANGFSKVTRYPWRIQAKMVLDLVIRVLLITLLTLALFRDSFVWSWIWLIPPIIAIFLNLRIVWSMPNRTVGDILTAIILFPAEMYLWFRLGTWTISWITTMSGSKRDGWAAQYKAEGKPTS